MRVGHHDRAYASCASKKLWCFVDRMHAMRPVSRVEQPGANAPGYHKVIPTGFSMRYVSSERLGNHFQIETRMSSGAICF